MKDSYSREIDYLKISLTDKCNLSCVYCKDEDESFQEYVNDGLTVDDYKFLIKNCNELGIDKIKFVAEVLLPNIFIIDLESEEISKWLKLLFNCWASFPGLSTIILIPFLFNSSFKKFIYW